MTNLKTPSIDIAPTQVAAVMDWLNRSSVDAHQSRMSSEDVQKLVRGDRLIMHEATMGEGNDGVERIYAPGTFATFWLLERLGSPFGLAVTLIIGPRDDDEAIVNCFYENDPSGFPFRRAEPMLG